MRTSDSSHYCVAMRRVTMIGLLATLLADGCVPPDERAPDEGMRPPPDAADLPSFAADIPDAEIPDLDLEMALTLASMPLSCLDRPHAAPRDRRNYLDTLVATRVPGYEDSRAFYGCWDWHSAVNSTWAMVRLYKGFPDIPVSGLIEEKLNDHLSEEALAGEIAFFEESRSFERPYGWAWLLKLHAELSTWDHAAAGEWAAHVEPLATVFSERMVEYLADLKVPSRSGTHSNTAFSLTMILEAARVTRDLSLETAIVEAAERLFGEDFGCPTAYEPWGSDFLSPCLEEAALMAQVLDTDDFITWLDDFLPPLTSREFAPLTRPTDPDDVITDETDNSPQPSGVPADDEATEEERQVDAERRFLASTSHLIGLAFTRADAINRIVASLPEGDQRIPALRKIAVLHGSRGFDAMFDADYAGSHWIGTFALKYLLTEREPGTEVEAGRQAPRLMHGPSDPEPTAGAPPGSIEQSDDATRVRT